MPHIFWQNGPDQRKLSAKAKIDEEALPIPQAPTTDR